MSAAVRTRKVNFYVYKKINIINNYFKIKLKYRILLAFTSITQFLAS